MAVLPQEKVITVNTAGMFPTDDEVEDLLTHIDDDGSRMVDYQELLRHMAAQVSIATVLQSSQPSHSNYF